jgi:hypothetical protein
MAAPDESDFDGSDEIGELPDIEAAEVHAAELPAVAPDLVTQMPEPPIPEPVAAPAPPAMMSEPLLQPPIQPAIKPSIQPSLGSTLIASGMLLGASVAPDPLAPIRRMSQAEKIAFFS